MTAANNPASRLAGILREFDRLVADHREISSEMAWREVLGTPRDGVRQAVIQVGRLTSEVTACGKALGDVTGDESVSRAVNLHAKAWVSPVVHWEDRVTEAARVPREALASLDVIATVLASTMPEPAEPGLDEILDWRSQIEALIDAVVLDETVDSELRLMIIRRLYGIIEALDELRVVGPDGLQAACERVSVAIALSAARPRWHSLAIQTMGRIFSALGFANRALEAFDDVENVMKAIDFR